MKGRSISIAQQRLRYAVSDLLMSALAFCLFNVYRSYALHIHTDWGESLGEFLLSAKMMAEECLVPLGMMCIYWLSGYYNRPFDKSKLQELVTTVFSAIINSLVFYLLFLIDDPTGHRTSDYKLILVLFGLLLALTYIGRLTITLLTQARLKDRRWAFNTVIVGNSPSARNMALRLSRSNTRMGCNVLGYLPMPGENDACDQAPVLTLEQVSRMAERHEIDQFVMAPEHPNEQRVLDMVFLLFQLNVPVKIAPDTMSYVTAGIHLQDIYGEPFVDLTSPRCSDSANNIKRVMDVILSAAALVALSPVLGVLAVLVKRSSPGPVIYSQERIGYRQKPFDIYKFRSMRNDAEQSGPRLSSDSDNRVTPLGRVMRKYRLDELPQFWNVLKGDMSLVGPRPEREYFIRQIVSRAPYYTLVHQVRPGLTSWGMVKYGYASTIDQMVERTRFDLIYLSNMSTLVDLKIMIYTLKTVITGRGV